MAPKAKLTEEERITKRSYDRVAADWESRHQKPFWQDEFQKLKKLLPAGTIIEVGCGTGRDAKKLIELGYKYKGVDISEAMVQQARKNNLGAEFEVASVYDIAPEYSFDAFWCAATLIHIPKRRINEALKALKGCVMERGLGFISVKEGSGEGLENREELADSDFFFAYYQDDEFRKILDRNGLKILSKRRQYVSERTTWLIYLLRSVG